MMVAKPATAEHGRKACSSIEGGLLITESNCFVNQKNLLCFEVADHYHSSIM